MTNRTVLYHVEFHPDGKRPVAIGRVHAIADDTTVTAYHLDHNGDKSHLVPDYAAIREAIPHYHRKAYDRAIMWWFTMDSRGLTGLLNLDMYARKSLFDTKGKRLGT